MGSSITFEELDKAWRELSTCMEDMHSTRAFADKWGIPRGTAHGRLQKLVDMGFATKAFRTRKGGGIEAVWGMV